jgi:sulfate permease, SulP family
VLSTLFVSLFNIPVETIGSKFGGIPQALPSLQLPDFEWSTAKQLYGPMLTIAVLGAIESLLCARVADAMTDDRHDPNQELMGQGIANIVAPFFGGIPATGTIARTVTNIKSGAVSPIAGIVHSLSLLAVILIAAPLASNIPLCALAAILVFVAWNMGNWREFSRLRRMTASYKVTLLVTFFLTVVFDLTVAVEFGIVVACIFFLIRMNSLTTVEKADIGELPERTEAWHVKGTLFFGSVSKLEHVTDPHRQTASGCARIVILDFSELFNIDNSAMDQIEVFVRALHRHHHELIIAGAKGHPLMQLRRTGIADRLGPNLVPDMKAAVARAEALTKSGRLED